MLGTGTAAGTLSGIAVLHELAAALAGTGTAAATVRRKVAIASALSGSGALADASIAARFHLVSQILGAGDIAGAIAVLGELFPGSIDLTGGLSGGLFSDGAHGDSIDAEISVGDSATVDGGRSGSADLG